MEAQLSQLTGMVEKALNKKRLGKKQVSEEDSVFIHADNNPLYASAILLKHQFECNFLVTKVSFDKSVTFNDDEEKSASSSVSSSQMQGSSSLRSSSIPNGHHHNNYQPQVSGCSLSNVLCLPRVLGPNLPRLR